MSNVWFTSDTHFDHRLVAKHRGFTLPDGTTPDPPAHDAFLVEVWNHHVSPKDTVFHLGDVSIGSLSRSAPWLAQLNGTIHLIAGNHDAVHPMNRDSFKKQRAWLEHFASIQTGARRKFNGQEFLLSHFPFDGEGARTGPDRHTQWRLRDEGLPLVHGHTHDPEQRLSFSANGTPMLHVGWDAWGRPVAQEEAASLLLDTLAAVV